MTKEALNRVKEAVSYQSQFPPKSAEGRILWKSFKNEEWLRAYFQSEAAKFVGENGDINNRLLREKKQTGFYAAIDKYYPGGIFQLRGAIGISSNRRSNGFWTEEKMKNEAKTILDNQGELSDDSLRKLGRSDLLQAVYTHYPGGWRELKQALGVKVLRKRNFWTPERIVAEAQKCYQEFETFSSITLTANGRSDLVNAIESKYPGGWRKLRADLGIDTPQRPNGFWTEEAIEEEARRILQNGCRLTDKELLKNGYQALRSALRKYPGGVKSLRAKLQISGVESNGISKNQANTDLDNLFREGV